jgi:toxin-antitoxin system PIN domain toxin
VKLLLDVNGLIALLHVAHPDHAKARLWLAATPTVSTFHTCSITELGFVRVSLAAKLCTSVTEAKGMLAALLAQPRFTRLADDLGADSLPAYVKKPAEVTDGHLLALATRHGAKLATLDTGIPGAELIA